MRLHSLILITALISTPSLFSQDEEPPAVNAIVDEAQPVPDAVPQQPAPQNNLANTLIEENIEFSPISGEELADLYREYTGRRVIVSSAAATAEFTFNQPASPEKPLTYAQAAELLRKAATIENFVFVPDPSDPSLDILTLATGGLKPTGRGVAVYTENDILPEGDAVISYVMPLDYIKPDEAVRVFTQIVGQFGAFGSIAAVPNAASIIITENTSLIRKLIDLKEQIDKPSTQVATRFIPVKFADVTELATTLNELLGNQQQTNTTAGIQRAPQQIPGAELANVSINADMPGSSGSAEQTPVQIIPDARTNRIFAMGRPVDLLFVEGLVREFDTESDQRNFLRRKLKFLAVADFLPIAGDALNRAFSGTGTAGAEAGGTPQSQGSPRNTSTNNRAQNNNSNNNLFNSGNSQSGAGGLGGSGSSGGNRSNSLSNPQANSAPVSLLIGRTLLVADNITNSIVVQGPPSSVEIIQKLLDQVDVRAEQVMISTVFGQLTLGDTTSTGVDWLRAFQGGDDGGFAFSNITGGNNTSVNPSTITNPITGTVAGTFPAQTGLSLYGKIGNSLGAYVNLLSSSTDFTVLARPSIFTANNQLGTISSGRRIAIPTNSNQFGGTSGVSTNIEYRDVVLKLEVIPLVNSPDEITLQIALVSDDVIGESDNIEGIGSVPIIGTRELLTTVTVPNNQTIVLGGLITTNDTETVTGIPILSDIPGLGRLFSTKTQGVDRDELMIFIQPSIVANPDNLNKVQSDMNSRYNVSEDSLNFAEGSVLPPRVAATQENIPANTPTAQQTKAKKRNSRPLHRR